MSDLRYFIGFNRVSGIGPAKALVDKSLVMQAHALGLSVTPYTFRSSNTGRFKTVREEMSYYLYSLGVDALFTDNPDLFPRARITEEMQKPLTTF